MKKIINVHLAGLLIPMEDTAYDLLKAYIESLQRHFGQEEGGDEIVSDIEARIGELFQEQLRKGGNCITDDDVHAVIAAMGRPEELGGETESSSPATPQPSVSFRPRKRLYRDPDDKILGGVCGGLGAYFGVDPVIFRLVFALLLFGAGTGVLLYLVLWIAVPRARTAAEKLEMRGERVDLQNISQAVKEELSGVKSKAQDLGKEAAGVFKKKETTDIGEALREIILALLRVVGWAAKVILILIGLVIIFSLGVTLIALIGSSAIVIPLKSFIWVGAWPGMLFWPALVLVLGIPVVAFMIFLIRKLAGAQRMHAAVGYGLVLLWLLGLLMVLYMTWDVGHHFRVKRISRMQVDFHQPSGKTLYVKLQPVMDESTDAAGRYHMILGDWISLRDDSLFYPNVHVHIIPAPENDSFRIEILKSARGATGSEAFENARRLSFSFAQQDSVISLPDAVPLPSGVPFRNQQIEVNVYVPNNKQAFLLGAPAWQDPYQHGGDEDEPDDEERFPQSASNQPKPHPLAFSGLSISDLAPGWRKEKQADTSSSSEWMDGLLYLFFSLFNIQPQ
ncbi:MAG: PspC domain-containing protein [Thermoflavifilum sp.]|nr:PspC domain-containing protein [Thermoflavifilum sp.]